ncbi:PREDICTED: retinol dehydrogenase 10-like [Gekko japonicus]|uniref:Retinol dehydrogenase 10-like n=1 Tax=Gekko japonicus TaxID=146911 RepID=A0ABM1JY57_GEKJA|nr:PREDICTED: retinol dehydrogenase 10-like [Gekko japonicus]
MAVLTDFLMLTVEIFRCIIHSLLQWIMKPPEKTVANEICLIAGAASTTGIGRLLALEFAQRRATLVLWDVDSEGNENIAREVRELGVRAYAYTCDVSRREEVYAAAEKVRRDVGDVTILVNNASIVTRKPILQCPDELLERTMRTNCHAHFWTVKAFLPQMIKKGHGHIVTIAGSLGLFATGSMEGYCASKFAVVGFHEALSHELKAKRVNGVKTTLVCPYFGDTGLSGCFGIRQELEAMISPVNPGCWVKSAMQGILHNQHMVCIPRVMYFAMISKNFLPWDVQVLVQKFLGLDKYVPQKEANCATGR